MDAISGDTQKANWSLDGIEDTSAYTENDWSNAKAYDAHILPWVLQLLAKNKPIIAKYPEDQREWFSVEDAAAYDQAFRDAGFNADAYNHALPKNGDLTADQARTIALQAMQKEYGMTRDQLKAYTLTTEYVLNHGGEWLIGFYGKQGMGNVELNAVTGEIQEINLDSAASANS